jgi:peptidoglycan/LPS O-acetylase OafA/YrhL
MSATLNRRVLQLDVLRGIAILLVVGRHLEISQPDGLVGVLARTWFALGWIGVDLFFVLSGFLIGGLLLSEHRKHGEIHVGRFLLRRGLKIYPPYLVFIAYLVLMPVAKAILAGGDGLGVAVTQSSLYWPNLLFVQNYVGTNPAGHTWSLAVEEHFYMLLPFGLVALIARRRMHWLPLVCLCVVPVALLLLRAVSVGTADSFASRMAATHLRLDALLFGVGLRAVSYFRPESFASLGRHRRTLVIAGVVLWLPNLFIDPSTAFVRTIGLTATFLGSAAFLVAAYHTREDDFRLSRWAISPTASLVGWIGVYSYSIYLWHVTVIGIVGRTFGRATASYLGDASPLAWVLRVVVITGVVVLVGVIMTKLVEWPVLRFRDRLFPSRSASLPSDVGEVARSHGSPVAGAIAVGAALDPSPREQ